jgi:plasmid stability protein
MGVTVQVRDLDPVVSQKLRDAAAREGMSLSAFLRKELTSLAKDLEARMRADALNSRNSLGGPYPGLQGIDIQEIVDMIREDRDNR